MKLFIAYSGGLDSHVLLHVLSQVREYCPIDLTAIHVNHSLSKNAKLWERHCVNTCKKLNIKCIVKKVNAKIKIKNKSGEEIARDLRYAVFKEILPQNALLVTAHHADDQAETLLLQLFRGAGVKGLAAMTAKVEFAKGWLGRPLLNCSRDELLQYAKQYNLSWIEDESNVDIKYRRNLIRHKLMPLIKKNWPGAVTTINRAAQNCSWADEILESVACDDLKKIGKNNLLAPGFEFYGINIKLLKKMDLARQYNVVRYWISSLGLPSPSLIKLQEVFRSVINSKSDTDPLVEWPGAQVRRFLDYIYATDILPKHDNTVITKLDKHHTLRFRSGGEFIKIPKRRGTHSLKKLMQEWRIPPWLRDRIGLIYFGDELISVIGYYNAYEFNKST